jgi:hypothetical protein
VTPLTPSYADGVLICSCDSSILKRFLCANARGLPERTESRRRCGEDGVDQEETEERDVWISRELVNRQIEEQAEAQAEAEVDEKA